MRVASSNDCRGDRGNPSAPPDRPERPERWLIRYAPGRACEASSLLRCVQTLRAGGYRPALKFPGRLRPTPIPAQRRARVSTDSDASFEKLQVVGQGMKFV